MHLLDTAAAQQHQRAALVGALGRQQTVQVVNPAQNMFIELEQNVAGRNTCFGRRALR